MDALTSRELRTIALRLSGQGRVRPHLETIARILPFAEHLTAGECWQLDAFAQLAMLQPKHWQRLREIEAKAAGL